MTTAPIEHVPVRPVRTTFPESVYLRLWQKLMAIEGMPKKVYGDWPAPIDQRAATVGASFVMWLGTNCGQGFIREADTLYEKRREAKLDYSRWRAYLMRWAVENTRTSGINSGLRVIEHILTPKPLREDGGAANWPAIIEANITIDDFDAIERVLAWLAEHDGQEFLRGACAAAAGEMRVQQMLERNAP